MKWCFIVNNAPFLTEFFIKLSYEVVKSGDECLMISTNKFVDYERKPFFPAQCSFLSKVEWCLQYYRKDVLNFPDLTWKEFFPVFDRVRRLPMTYEIALERVNQEYQFYTHIFEKQRPDAILFEPPSGVGSEIAYLFAKKKGIPYLGLVASRMEGRFDTFDVKYTDSRFRKTFERLNMQDITQKEREFAAEYIDSFISHKRLPSYVGIQKIHFSPLGFISHYISQLRKHAGVLRQYMKERNRVRRYDFEAEARWRRSLAVVWENLKRQIRIRQQEKMYRLYDEKDKGKFYLYPLQLQPESSTSVFATFYSDQVNAIRNMAFTIPFPYKLYVKEHPSAIGKKFNSFYKEICRIPQVVLISPYEDTSLLIQHSRGVITLTSTIGMEAVLAGKPTYVLGNVFYDFHPYCRRVKNFDHLRELIWADHQEPPQSSQIGDMNMRFMFAYLKNTIEGSLIVARDGEDTNAYGNICNALRKRIQEQMKGKEQLPTGILQSRV